MTASHGNSQYRIPVDLAGAGEEVRLWESDTPWLYQVQVSLYFEGQLCDVKKQQDVLRGDFDQLVCMEPQMTVGEKLYEGKRYIINMVDLRCENPVAKRFQKALYGLGANVIKYQGG